MKTRSSYFLLPAVLIFLSCQKSSMDMEPVFSEFADLSNGSEEDKGVKLGNSLTLYFGHETFKRDEGTPVTEKLKLVNPDLICFGPDFYLNIMNGNSKETRVTSAEITIDGVLIASPSDFSKNISFITKQLPNLAPESVLEVKLNSSPGSFIELWIEGMYNKVIPEFSPIGPLLQNSEAPVLPATSKNNIPGSWEPTAINTSAAGTFTFTFTPDNGYCAEVVKTDVEITDRISDIEGNSYKVVRIGNQFWMAENLKSTRFNNGDAIESTNPATLSLANQVNPIYQWPYSGSDVNAEIYGRLYTWYAVTDTRGLCTQGWHVSSDADWTKMSDYLINNGFGFEGSGSDIAKSLGSSSRWSLNPTQGNTGNNLLTNNTSGFNAYPAGYKNYTGPFSGLRSTTRWWSSSPSTAANAFFYNLMNSQSTLNRTSGNKKHGYSVRCVKD